MQRERLRVKNQIENYRAMEIAFRRNGNAQKALEIRTKIEQLEKDLVFMTMNGVKVEPSEREKKWLQQQKILNAVKIITVILLVTLAISLSMVFQENQELKQDVKDLTVIATAEQSDLPQIPDTIVESGWATPPYDVPLQSDYIWYTISESAHNRVDPKLTLAVMAVESGYDIDAVSKTGDYGLMQINKSNFGWLQCDLGQLDMMNPRHNITAGTYMLGGYLLDHDGNVSMALMEYNMGTKKAQELWDKGIFETDYTQKVMTKYYEI